MDGLPPKNERAKNAFLEPFFGLLAPQARNPGHSQFRSLRIYFRDSKKPVQEGSFGLVFFGAGHVASAEPPELSKGGAFEIRAETAKPAPLPPFEHGCPGELPHGRR